MKRMFHALRRAVMMLIFVSLVWNTVDIVLRRWWWDQIPSQISAPVVYGLLLANLLMIAFIIRSGTLKAKASGFRAKISPLPTQDPH